MEALTAMRDRLVSWFGRSGRLHSVALYGGLVVAVVVVWCGVYGRFPGDSRFRIPVEYRDDALALMGIMKGFSELPAPWNLHVSHLNAPFGADWNDYPHSEKLLFYLGGILAKCADLGAAANFLLLLGFVSNALAFCWVARRLGASPLRGWAGAIMFAFSTYMLWRCLAHLILVYAGTIPLLFYLCHRLQQGQLDRRALWIWGTVYMALSAFLNPYYFIFALLMLSLVALRLVLVGARPAAILTGILVGEGALLFVVNHANVWLHRWRHGPSTAYAGRHLTEQLLFGLRLPDLFFPIEHPLGLWGRFARARYLIPGIDTNNIAAFLGLVGCVGLFALLAVSVARGMRGRYERIPAESWYVLVAYLFGSVGGVCMLLGVFGFSWLRASARYSIVILCAVLLWASRSFRVPRWPALGSVFWCAAAVFTVFESYDAWEPSRRGPPTAQVLADRAFASELESRLPRGAAVFQLPLMDYPDTLPVAAMRPYEPLRPYLWSRTLRFSFGAHSGRPREQWQAACARKPARDMVAELAGRGFSAVVLHRAGFVDRGRALENALVAVGLTRVAGNGGGDMVAYRVK
ncbi:MAG: hypothetical protein JXP73_19035 [Deltaproteobacteria bacterium]|nr:hypothetical protein [Deltaproteobacteria bacterium]